MIQYYISGSYYLEGGITKNIEKIEFSEKSPLLNRKAALDQMQSFRDVMVSGNDENAINRLFKYSTEINFEIKDKSKVSDVKNITFHGGISLYAIWESDDGNEEWEIDKIGLPLNYETIDNIAISLQQEYQYYIDNGLNTENVNTITSYSFWDYHDFGEINSYTFNYMPSNIDISITRNLLWWADENEILELYHKLQNDKAQVSSIEMIGNGESLLVEFKPSLLYNFTHHKGTYSIKYVIAKTICSMLNSDGGRLFIGINDNGKVQGLEADFRLDTKGNPKDFFYLEFMSMLTSFFSKDIIALVKGDFEIIDDKIIFVVKITPSSYPVFINNKMDPKNHKKEFFVRGNASSQQIMDIEEIIKYVFNHFKKV